MPLRRFLSLVESRPEFSYPSVLLGDAIGALADRALRAADILVPRGAATWYPCARGLRGCTRLVAADPTAGCLQVLCGRTPGQCPTESFAERELGQHVLDDTALVTLLQGLFGAGGQPPRPYHRGAALCLGERVSPGDGREVWFWLRPKEPDFSQWARELEDRPQQALVLVPTPTRVHVDTFDRYGPGRPVHVVHLSRALTVDGGGIALAGDSPAHPARVPWTVARPVERPHARIHTPAGCRWGDITVERVDGQIVAVRVGNQPPARLSAAELGLTSDNNAEPTVLWDLLLELCDGSGTCTRGSVGAATIGVLKARARRLGQRLCAVFGIQELPLHVSSDDESVRADFRAFPLTRREAERRR